MSDDRHVFRAVSFSQAGLVLREYDVEHPMQPVFDAPMAAHSLGGLRRGEFGGGDIVAGLEAGAVVEFGARLHADDRGGCGQPKLAGKTPVAVEPVDLVEDVDRSLFDTAMALVVIDVGVEVGGGGEGVLRLGAQCGLIGLDGEQVIAARLPDRLGDLGVGGDASMETSAPFNPPPSASLSINTGIAWSSLALLSTASWPSTRRLVVAKAETRCSGPLSPAWSWLRREVLPSMAMSPGRSGQVSRTQAVKAAENNAGLILFINCVSQRPPGTP